jgi:transcriptional regulator with GAF, ATPase, and Fis domain/tetratricopeptide (TPR) repeat protein
VLSIDVPPLSETEVQQLLVRALPFGTVKSALVREAQAVSGGLAGRLCRVLCAGLALGDEMLRSGQLRAHAEAAGAADQVALPVPALALAQALAVYGGSTSQEVADELLGDCVELAAQARTLVALGACSFGPRSELSLRPDLAVVLWAQLGTERRAELGKRMPIARLDARARAFVACACGDHERAHALFLTEIAARMRRGEPETALALAADALAVLPAHANVALHLAEADALRALGHYAQAMQRLEGLVGAEVDLACAELLRLLGQRAQARQRAEQVCGALATQRGPIAAAASAILARLSLDAGEVEQAARLAGEVREHDVDDASWLRASEVLALCQAHKDEREAARATAEQALVRARARGERAAQARLLAVLGTVHRAQGELRLASDSFAQAFEQAQAAGEYHAAASFLVNVGTSRLDGGELGPALQACREGARRLARLGREGDLARVLYNLALAAQLTGDHDVALAALSQAERSAKAASDSAALAFSTVLAAEIHAERGERALALSSLHALPEPTDLPALERGVTFARAAVVAADLADEALAEQYVACADEHGEPAGAECELAHCALLRLRGQPRAAFDAAQRAVSDAQRRGEFGVHVTALLAAARTAEAVNDAAMARQRFAELRSLLDAAALTLAPAERARLREVKAYRAALAAVPVVRQAQAGDERWRKLAALTKRFTAEHRVSRIHEILLEAALDLSGAERGYVLWNDSEGVARVRAGRGLDREAVRADAVSRSIVQRVISGGQALSTVDAAQDVRLSGAASVHALALRSVLAVPIVAHGEVRGALYLDDRLRPFAFGEAEIALLSDLGDLAAVALESAERLRRERRAVRRLQIARERLSRQVQAQALELASLKRTSEELSTYPGIVAHSAPMQRALELALRVGASDVPVLLRGESGSGKELIARAIHEQSTRKLRPLVSENCGAIPETLLESALFGHMRGAFTGAERRRLGLFEVADGGTLFLDEIGEMSPAMQSRLLRVLQDGEIRPVGAERSLTVDVRVIAATHRDLEAMVKEGSFREDLYYRLAVVPVHVPPLRERVEDIAPLVQHFIEKYAAGRKVRVDRRALDVLCAQRWPGNVRQLENEVRRALVLAGDVIREEHWSFGASRDAQAGAAELDLRAQVDQLERRLIRRALDSAKGNQTKAAQLLGVSRFGLQKMQKRLATPR